MAMKIAYLPINSMVFMNKIWTEMERHMEHIVYIMKMDMLSHVDDVEICLGLLMGCLLDSFQEPRHGNAWKDT